MSSLGPGDKPAVVRKRARKNRQAKPLAAKPPRKMARASEPKVKIRRPAAKPLQAKPPRSYAPASEPGLETSTRSQRGAAVAAYDMLNGAQKQAALEHARKHPGTATSRAILHIHDSRKARNLELRDARGRATGVSDDEMAAVEAFKASHRYQDALKAARQAHEDYQAARNIAEAGEANKHHTGETGNQVLNTAGPNDFDKVLAPLRKSTKASVLTVLDQLDRPIHAIAGAAKEDVKHIQEKGLGDYLLHGGGKDALHAAVRGAENKDRTTFSDVLDQAGVHNKYVKAIAGFGLDVALDPTTYLTLGVGVPAKVAAKGAERAVLRAGREAVKAGEMTQAELERKALHTAKEVYDAHPEHAKHLGVRVGVRGAPVRAGSTAAQAIKQGSLKGARHRAERQVMSAPVGTRANQAIRALGRAFTTQGMRERAADLTDRTAQQLVHDWRPRAVHPIEHDYIRRAAARYRAAREGGDRFAQTRTRALHNAISDADDEATIIHAIENGAVRNLPDDLRQVAEAAQRDLEHAGLAEVERGLRTTADIKGAAPLVPEPVTIEDVRAARSAARDAVKAAREAEHSHLESLQGYGVARGRASILSRQVDGTAGEREAEAADAIQAAADVAAGGHGMRQAGDALAESTARVHALRLGAEDAKKHLGLTLEQHQEYQSAAADALEHALKPEGYFPRYQKADQWDPDYERFATPRSGGEKVTGTSFQGRKYKGKLSDLPEEEAAKYDMRVAANVGRRLQEHGRAMALSELHDRAGALGRRIEDPEELDALLEAYPDATQRLLQRTPQGFKQLTDKRGQIDLAAAKRAIAHGEEVVEVPRAAMKHLEDLRMRGRNVGDLDEHTLLRGFDRVQGKIKTLQTAVNPGYHGTNLIGDTFNARIGGALPSDLAHAARLKWVEMGLDKAKKQLDPVTYKRVEAAAHRTERYGDETLSDADLVHEAIDTGAINTGFAGHELPELVQGKELSTRKFRPMDWLRGASEHREDLVRLATYRAARKRGLSPDEAADWVAKHHFDYGDLTKTERGFMRRVIPFYTFMARNTRLQVAALGRAPGTLASYGKAREESAKAAGVDPDFARSLQEYEQQGVPMALPIKVGGNPVVLYPKLPITDLNNLTDNPDTLGMNLVGRETVPAKVLIEQLLKTNTFTRAPYSKARVPAPDQLRDPKVRAAVNAFFRNMPLVGASPAVKDIQDPQTGKMVPGWSWRIDELARQIPVSSMALNATTESRNKHPQDWKLALTGYGLGPRPQILDPERVALNQLWDRHDKLDAQIKELKQTVHHKSGAKWKGKVGKMSKQLGKLEVQIAKTSKAAGIADPPFANRIGHHKRKAAAKAFGARGGSTKMYGAGG